MKKLLPYIAILTILVGVLGYHNVNAQAYGQCTISVDTTPSGCKKDGGTWTPNKGVTGCIDNDTGKPMVGVTSSVCPLSGGFWIEPPQASTSATVSTYAYLAPLGSETTFNPGEKNALTKYLNIVIKTLIGVAAVLAMIMVLMGGIEYMTSDLVSSKAAGKQRVTDALIGLLLALSAYLLLFTINPNLLKSEPDIPNTGVSADITNPNYQNANTGALDSPGVAITAGSGSNNTKVAVSKSGFINSDWQNEALADVRSSGLLDLKPSDSMAWFGHSTPTESDWVNLIVGISYSESRFDPKAYYMESTGIPSVGLLQLSTTDCTGSIGLGACTQTQLQDPLFNLKLGIKILTKLVSRDGVIAQTNPTGNPKYTGAARYWSTMRAK